MTLIVNALAADLGPAMARASVLGVAARLGFTLPLQRDELRRLVDELAPGLAVFLGRERAAHMLDRVRVTLNLGGPR